jgi:hypothetical protein
MASFWLIAGKLINMNLHSDFISNNTAVSVDSLIDFSVLAAVAIIFCCVVFALVLFCFYFLFCCIHCDMTPFFIAVKELILILH